MSPFFLSAAAAAAQPPAPVLAEDFDFPGGAIAAALLRDPHLSLADGEGVAGGHAIRATYVGNRIGSQRIGRTIWLGEQGLEYTLTYDVKFDVGFQFVRGGKLHGLGPASTVTGGDRLRPDGWSARVMWREYGRAATYTYHQDQQGRYGEAGTGVQPVAFQPGRYQAVSLHVRLNQPANAANGFVRLYVDGKLVEARERLRLRAVDSEASLISRFLFSTFHGGSDPSWAPRRADGRYARLYAWFDNIGVYRGERIRSRPGE